MSPAFTSILVLAILAPVVVLAVYTMWKDHKKGKSCSCGGDCSHCKGCH